MLVVCEVYEKYDIDDEVRVIIMVIEEILFLIFLYDEIFLIECKNNKIKI